MTEGREKVRNILDLSIKRVSVVLISIYQPMESMNTYMHALEAKRFTNTELFEQDKS